jgi:HEAT repeat protein
MVFYCTNCWKEIDKGARICPYCGSDLSKLDNVSFADKLIHALNHPEPETPIRAANILGQLKVKEAVPFLIKRLENEKDPFIIEAVVHALLNIDLENAKKYLPKILAENVPITVKKELEELEKK